MWPLLKLALPNFNTFKMLNIFVTNFVRLLLKRQLHKMVKHTQTIRGQQPTNCLSVFDHFMGLMPKGLKFFLYCSLITSHLFLEFDRNIFYEMGELGLLGATINGKPLFVGNNAKRWISKRVFQEKQSTPTEKRTFLTLWYAHVCKATSLKSRFGMVRVRIRR